MLYVCMCTYYICTYIYIHTHMVGGKFDKGKLLARIIVKNRYKHEISGISL